MKWAVVLLALPALLACSAVGFQPAECSSLSPDSSGWLNDRLYRDLMRGTYAGDCFKFTGVVAQSVEGGYVVDTEGYGTGYPGDVFVRWEGDYRFVEGDLVIVTGAVVEPLTFETVIGAQRTIPAFYGSDMGDLLERSRATRQIVEATKQVEYQADYERMTVEVHQEVQSCRELVTKNMSSWLEKSYGSRYRDRAYAVSKLELNFSIGPAPDDIDADTVPNIIAEGNYIMESLLDKNDKKYGQITEHWFGESCVFRDTQINESAEPTRDPNVTPPTFTPRPKPTKEKRQ